MHTLHAHKTVGCVARTAADFGITSKLGPLLGIFRFTDESKSITLLEKTHQITLLSPHTHSVFS